MGGSTPPPPPLVSSNSALAATMMATMKHITTRLGAMETAMSTGTKTGVTHVTTPPPKRSSRPAATKKKRTTARSKKHPASRRQLHEPGATKDTAVTITTPSSPEVVSETASDSDSMWHYKRELLTLTKGQHKAALARIRTQPLRSIFSKKGSTGTSTRFLGDNTDGVILKGLKSSNLAVRLLLANHMIELELTPKQLLLKIQAYWEDMNALNSTRAISKFITEACLDEDSASPVFHIAATRVIAFALFDMDYDFDMEDSTDGIAKDINAVFVAGRRLAICEKASKKRAVATAALLVKAKDTVNVVEDNTLEPGEIFDPEDTEDSGDDSGAPPAKKAKKDVPAPTPTRVSARLKTPQAANSKPTSG